MPGWWFTIESTTSKHFIQQLKTAVEDALRAKPTVRAIMRARATVQRFPVSQWVEDLENLQSTAIATSHKQAVKEKRPILDSPSTPAILETPSLLSVLQSRFKKPSPRPRPVEKRVPGQVGVLSPIAEGNLLAGPSPGLGSKVGPSSKRKRPPPPLLRNTTGAVPKINQAARDEPIQGPPTKDVRRPSIVRAPSTPIFRARDNPVPQVASRTLEKPAMKRSPSMPQLRPNDRKAVKLLGMQIPASGLKAPAAPKHSPSSSGEHSSSATGSPITPKSASTAYTTPASSPPYTTPASTPPQPTSSSTSRRRFSVQFAPKAIPEALNSGSAASPTEPTSRTSAATSSTSSRRRFSVQFGSKTIPEATNPHGDGSPTTPASLSTVYTTPASTPSQPSSASRRRFSVQVGPKTIPENADADNVASSTVQAPTPPSSSRRHFSVQIGSKNTSKAAGPKARKASKSGSAANAKVIQIQIPRAVDMFPSWGGHYFPHGSVATLSTKEVKEEKPDNMLQNVTPFFSDPQKEYEMTFQNKLQTLDGKNSENQLCIEEYLLKSEKSWFGKRRAAELTKTTGKEPPDKIPTTMVQEARKKANDDGFGLGTNHKPPSGLQRVLRIKIGDWPIYSFLLAFVSIPNPARGISLAHVNTLGPNHSRQLLPNHTSERDNWRVSK